MKLIYHDGYREVVKALKQRRLALGLSQQQVAAQLGCCRTRVARIEMCEIKLDVHMYWQLCQMYRITPGRLLRLLGRENPPP